jgi:hypothetical protein
VLQIHTGYTEAVKDVVDVDPKSPPKVGGHDNSSPRYSDVEALQEVGNLRAVIDHLAAENPGIPITRCPPLTPHRCLIMQCSWERSRGTSRSKHKPQHLGQGWLILVSLLQSIRRLRTPGHGTC